MGLSLTKQQEKVKLTLKKVVRGDNVPPVQMIFLTDVSGSMQGDYRSGGSMVPILQRSIALASIIDPDKVVQIIAFDTKAYALGDFGVDEFDTVASKLLGDNRFWGGTVYSTAFNKLLKERGVDTSTTQNDTQPKKKGFFSKLFGSKSADVVVANPTATNNNFTKNTGNEAELVVFFTDGQNDSSDHTAFKRAVEKVADENTYVLFVGSGGSPHYYSTLKNIADDAENIGFIHISNANQLTDDQFYDIVLSGEFGKWLEKFEVQA